MKRVFSVVLLLATVMMLGGCYDYSEPDEKAWILALGLDKGKQNVLTVTAVIAIPKAIAGGGGGEPAAGGAGGGTFFTVSMETPTLLSFLELLDTVVDRRADMSQTKWLVCSRELAEDIGIGKYFGPITRFSQFRRSVHVIICEGRAEDFLEQGKPILEDNVGKYYELLMRGWRYTEFIPFDTFHFLHLKSNTIGVAPVAPLAALNRKEPVYDDNTPKPKGAYQAGRLPRRGGGEIEVMGGAVFKAGRMVGTLDADQVGVQKMFFGNLKRTIMDVPDPEHPGFFIIVDVKPRYNPRVDVRIGEDDLPEISVEVGLEGTIMSIQSGEEYETPDRLPVLEQAVERAYLEDINKTVAKSQALGADFLGLGLHAKKLFLTWPQWVAYDWDTKYPDATINVSVDYRVRRVGLIHETVPLK
ncbi:MAG: Ger(x)C family spore germination protein [Desulfotomaculaceae bacterium]